MASSLTLATMVASQSAEQTTDTAPEQEAPATLRKANMISTILLIIITLFIPPIGVYLVAGCGADLLVNICLTLLGYFPGHIHAFYVEYVYYKRKEESGQGLYDNRPAPGIYSDNVQTGGRGYGTITQSA